MPAAVELLQVLGALARTYARRSAASIAIVANVAIVIALALVSWTFLDAVLIRELPFPETDRLALVDQLPRSAIFGFVEAPETLQQWKDTSHAFEDAALLGVSDSNISWASGGRRVRAVHASANLFQILGTEPLIGRHFLAGEDQPNAEPVAVISAGLWNSAFGGRAGAMGELIRVDGVQFELVGVVDGVRSYPQRVDIWTPSIHNERVLSAAGTLTKPLLLGRLRQSADLGIALAEQRDFVQHRFVAPIDASPGSAEPLVAVSTLKEHLASGLAAPLFALACMTVAVAVIGWSNVAFLLLAGIRARTSEFATAIALGASNRDLLGHLVKEILPLAAVGGAAGALATAWVLRVGELAMPAAWPSHSTVGIDGRAVAVAVVLVVSLSLLASVYPLRYVLGMQDGVQAALATGHFGARSRSQMSFGSLLLLLQIASVTALAVASWSGMRSVAALVDTSVGYSPDGIVYATVSRLREAGPGYEPARADRMAGLLDQIGDLSYVSSASVSDQVPGVAKTVTLGTARTPEGRVSSASLRAAAPRFFETLGIPLLDGRDFSRLDTRDAAPVSIVSRGLARNLWPDSTAVGERLSDGTDQYLVIGVVGDVRVFGPLREPMSEYYLPLSQAAPSSVTVVASVEGDPSRAIAALAKEILDYESGQVIEETGVLDANVARYAEPLRNMSGIAFLIGAVALLLTVTGIYGGVSEAVSQSRQSLAVRLAVGETHHGVLRTVVGRVFKVGLVAVALGSIAGVLGVRSIGRHMHGVAQADAATIVAASGLVLVAVGLVATLGSRGVMRIAPARILKGF